MKKYITTLIKEKRELVDSVVLTVTLILMFIIFIFQTVKDLPFVYNQF